MAHFTLAMAYALVLHEAMIPILLFRVLRGRLRSITVEVCVITCFGSPYSAIPPSLDATTARWVVSSGVILSRLSWKSGIKLN